MANKMFLVYLDLGYDGVIIDTRLFNFKENAESYRLKMQKDELYNEWRVEEIQIGE